MLYIFFNSTERVPGTCTWLSFRFATACCIAESKLRSIAALVVAIIIEEVMKNCSVLVVGKEKALLGNEMEL